MADQDVRDTIDLTGTPIDAEVADRSIGEVLKQMRGLDDAQIAAVLKLQRERGLRFGDAAVALKFISQEDVLWALSRQFHFPYATARDTSGLDRELVAAIDPFSDESEVFRDVRSQLLMGVLAPEQPRRALAVLSTEVGDGKTFFAANLAAAFSQLGGRTLLVDADMRTPRLHTMFGISRPEGLSSILAGRAQTDVIHQVPGLAGLYLLPVGTLPPNPLELVQRPAFGALIAELCSKFDHVLVDTPAASHAADARVVAAKCGAALLLGRRNRSRLPAMETLLQQLHKSQIGRAHV